MPVAVTCPSCRSPLRMPDRSAGKRGRCPKCKSVFDVPAVTLFGASGARGRPTRDELLFPELLPKAAGSPASRAAHPRPISLTTLPRDRLMQEVLGAFEGDIVPVERTLTYRIAAFLVAVAMVLLPAAYLAMIGGAVYGLCCYTTHIPSLLGDGQLARFALVLYAVPLLVGGILLLFMLKPLFARPARPIRVRAVDAADEPLLFGFVERVCRAIGAPLPVCIEVDCMPNASASLGGGLLGLFGRRISLGIGLPLAAALDVRQFAGVLAHELGHFAQGTVMRLTYIIGTINAWFVRVVYERDAWDVSLVEWSQSGRFGSVLIASTARLFVGLTRGALWVLMVIGHLISSFMLRQMEYDADRYWARLAGSGVFKPSMRRIALMDVASQFAEFTTLESWKQGRLPDDLAALTVGLIDRLPPELVRRIDAALAAHRIRLLDTHPALKDRVANVHAERAIGVFRLDGPATILFADFARLSRETTLDCYRVVLGRRAADCTERVPSEHVLDPEAAKRDEEIEPDDFDSLFLNREYRPL